MKKQKTNWVLTIVLILGTLTVFFPLYMAVIIPFKVELFKLHRGYEGD